MNLGVVDPRYYLLTATELINIYRLFGDSWLKIFQLCALEQKSEHMVR